MVILGKAIKATIHNIMTNPDAKLKNIPIVSEVEAKELIKQGNRYMQHLFRTVPYKKD